MHTLTLCGKHRLAALALAVVLLLCPVALAASAENIEALEQEYAKTLEEFQALVDEHASKGEYASAREVLEKTLALCLNVFGPDHPDTVVSMHNLALVHGKLGDHAKARELQEKVLDIHLRLLGPEHPETVQAINSLALTCDELGEYQRLKELTEKMLEVRTRQHGPDHPDIATAMFNYATALGHLGEYPRARELMEKATELFRVKYGPEDPKTLSGMSNLAFFYSNMGEYTRGMELQARVLELYQRLFGPEHPETALAMHNLASTCVFLGEYDKALELQKNVLELRRRVLGPEHPDTLESMSNLAFIHGSLEDYAVAREIQERVLELYGRIYAPDHPETLLAMNNLATTLFSLGEHGRAKELLERQVVLRQRIFGPEHPTVLGAMHNLASVCQAAGEHARARKLQEQVLKLSQRVLGLHHPDTSNHFNSLAHYLAQAGQRDMGVFYYQLAVMTSQYHREEQAHAGLEASLRSSYLKSIEFRYHGLIALLIAQGRLEDAQAVLELLKIDELSGMGDERGDRGELKAAWLEFVSRHEAALIDEYIRLGSILTALHKEKTAIQTRAAIQQPALQDAQQLREIEGRMALADRNFEEFLAQLPAALARGAAEEKANPRPKKNLENLRAVLRGLEPGTALVHTLCTESTLYVFFTTGKSLLLRYASLGRAEVDQLAATFHAQLRSPSLDPRPLARQLYTAILGPLEKTLEEEGIRTIMFSLDGALRYIPMAALHDGKGWLAERYATPMFTEAARNRLLDTPKLQATAVGFGVTRGMGEFAPLPSVAEELAGIIRNETNTQGILPGTLLLDNEFTHAALARNLQSGTPVMHLASHFHFNPVVPGQSFLLLGDGQRLFLSELASNRALSFVGLEQLTLSACETASGLGRGDGREVEGLGALMQKQGAFSVVATLWPIADASTSIFMQELYRQRFVLGQNKAEALRRAQLELMGRNVPSHTAPKDFELRGRVRVAAVPKTPQWQEGGYSHPFYWAPFILLGNWK